eukprot:4242009-Lingulodinium_polyedra.AAC.2
MRRLAAGTTAGCRPEVARPGGVRVEAPRGHLLQDPSECPQGSSQGIPAVLEHGLVLRLGVVAEQAAVPGADSPLGAPRQQ